VRTSRPSPPGDDWFIGRLCVVPDLQGRGLGRRLLEHAESTAPDGIRTFTLHTGAHSAENLRMYQKAGYRLVDSDAPAPGAVTLVKRRR
jgi:tRNA (guanine37-N1)-methyltransferase